MSRLQVDLSGILGISAKMMNWMVIIDEEKV